MQCSRKKVCDGADIAFPIVFREYPGKRSLDNILNTFIEVKRNLILFPMNLQATWEDINLMASNEVFRTSILTGMYPFPYALGQVGGLNDLKVEIRKGRKILFYRAGDYFVVMDLDINLSGWSLARSPITV